MEDRIHVAFGAFASSCVAWTKVDCGVAQIDQFARIGKNRLQNFHFTGSMENESTLSWDVLMFAAM